MADGRIAFPFVVGCPRSGTTLLRAMLDSHSQLAVPDESHFIVPMARRRERYERPEGLALEPFLADLFADERFRAWGLPEPDVRSAVPAARPSGVADGFRAVYALYADRRGKPRYGDKTPGYVRELPLLAELFSEARFVHVLRDGRDVVLSLREMPWARRGGLESLAGFWRTNVERALAVRGALGERRYLEVRYEQLVDDPERVLGATCAFLGLPYEPGMVAYHERVDEHAPSHRRVDRPPTRGLRDWRTQMSPVQVERFEKVAGDALEQAGYERLTPAR